MKLIDLRPHWVGAGGDGITDLQNNPIPKRDGIGLTFDCPCGCGRRRYVGFKNPIDGGSPKLNEGEPSWTRQGETFETLTLDPSIQASRRGGGCGWHGWIRNGQVEAC